MTQAVKLVESRILTVLLLMLTLPAAAQYNTDRLLTVGRSALYFEDYVLSIQYFNQAISAKPWLYEPWFYRAVAKYYLDDFTGAEDDCTRAISRNPFVTNTYELRGLARIQQKKYKDAIADYTRALRYDPENKALWNNRIVCRINDKDYDGAVADLDTVITRWSTHARAYVMLGEAQMLRGDTIAADSALTHSLTLNPYDDQPWAARASICLSRQQWATADSFLTKAIHLQPKHAGYHINRALARIRTNQLRGAMDDYDRAIDYEPENFLAHYNRGLLRADVGDDNRAIEDFNFVIRLAPEDIMAIYNRALLLDKTGDLRGAIRDYTTVINRFPNFWTGLQSRAACYRRLGQTRKAEADEFRVFKAQLYKRLYGRQPRMSADEIRKRGDIDPDKYNQLVVADEEDKDQHYDNAYRGRVQNRQADTTPMPMYAMTAAPAQNTTPSQYTPYDPNTDAIGHGTHLACHQEKLSDRETDRYFALIDTISEQISQTLADRELVPLLIRRAIAYTTVQNYPAAEADLTTALAIDSLSPAAYRQRAVCQARTNQFDEAQGTNTAIRHARVIADLTRATTLNPADQYTLYNRGCAYAALHDWDAAIADYTAALTLDPALPEAYYNRGLAYLAQKNNQKARADLSKAGELGLYQAYSIIKKKAE